MTTLLLLLAAFATAQQDCADAYQESYGTNWSISREDWDRDCADGAKPKEILRRRQGEFMEDCKAHFAAPAQSAGVSEWRLPILCAQGVAGESELAALTKTAAPNRAPAPVPAPAPVKPSKPKERRKR